MSYAFRDHCLVNAVTPHLCNYSIVTILIAADNATVILLLQGKTLLLSWTHTLLNKF